MNIRFLSLAQQEVDDAVAWYNEQGHNLGYEFLDELDRTVRRIRAFPEASQEVALGIRRCLMVRFPYGLIYGVDNETIIVIAVAHLHRKPRYWADRS